MMFQQDVILNQNVKGVVNFIWTLKLMYLFSALNTLQEHQRIRTNAIYQKILK